MIEDDAGEGRLARRRRHDEVRDGMSPDRVRGHALAEDRFGDSAETGRQLGGFHRSTALADEQSRLAWRGSMHSECTA